MLFLRILSTLFFFFSLVDFAVHLPLQMLHVEVLDVTIMQYTHLHFISSSTSYLSRSSTSLTVVSDTSHSRGSPSQQRSADAVCLYECICYHRLKSRSVRLRLQTMVADTLDRTQHHTTCPTTASAPSCLPSPSSRVPVEVAGPSSTTTLHTSR